MAREIFRKAALERMASPERVDRPTRLVGSSGWLILVCFVRRTGLGAIWAAQTKAPVKVGGQGILIDRAVQAELASEQGGLLQSIEIVPGDLVADGQVVATLSRSELRRELAGAEAKLVDLQDRFTRLMAAHRERTEREGRADRRRLETIGGTIQALSERLPLLQSRAEKLAPLARRKVVPEIRLIEAQIAVSDLAERIAVLDEDAQKVRLEAAERDSQREFEQLEDQLAMDEQARIIDRLRARLAEEQVIRAARAGQVVELKVNVGDVLPAGGAIATLTQLGEGRNLQALMYVPPAEGKRIEPGMAAEIAPTTVETEVYGHIKATILSVSPLPATPEGMRRVLQNDQLVEQLSLAGAPIEVRVSLTADPSTTTGFAWSSSKGPVSGVNAGTLLNGKIVIEEQPMIDLVVPGLSKKLALALEQDGS
ncbi:MAG: NHLP bacteriocin system secretion protein [Paracoccaceae bacterium]